MTPKRFEKLCMIWGIALVALLAVISNIDLIWVATRK